MNKKIFVVILIIFFHTLPSFIVTLDTDIHLTLIKKLTFLGISICLSIILFSLREIEFPLFLLAFLIFSLFIPFTYQLISNHVDYGNFAVFLIINLIPISVLALKKSQYWKPA